MPEKFIVDHDAGVDDFPAFSLLLCAPQIRVEAITICPADSYKKPAVIATKRFVDYLGAKNIAIAASDYEGKNKFPDEWRQDSYRLAELPLFRNLDEEPSNQVLRLPAGHFLAELLSGPDTYNIMTSGPLTNLADALSLNPSVKKHIKRIFMMAGAVRVTGNVDREGHDGSAEWNVFNNPAAARTVVRSGIPITMVALDVTNKVPLNRAFIERLKGQSQYRASRLAAAAFEVAAKYIDQQLYYFWDTLTAASIVKPDLLTTEQVKLDVLLDGPSQGRTIETADGCSVDLGIDTDREQVENLFLEIFSC